jgi:hypothetical protein
MTTAVDLDVYIAALHVDEIFADATYQRALDNNRARKMADTWDRRLAGILEVSDRGEHTAPRYAVLDGQHRWAAAGHLDTPPLLVANIHTGLSIAEEAQLFDKLNRQRKQTSTWDHWKARRAAGDPQVLAIEAVVTRHGMRIDVGPVDGYISCIATLEKIVKLGGTALLDDVLKLIIKTWGERRDGFDSHLVHGIALVLYHLNTDIDGPRLADTLLYVLPRQLKTSASALRDVTAGSMPVLTAIAIMAIYNKKPGRKLLVSNRTFGGGSINARSVRDNAVKDTP